MALEIVRKLVGGVWRTVLEDQGSGPGSTPNLAAVLAEGADAGGSAITGLDDPTADQDAATKKYVDDNGGSVPGSVRRLDLGVVDVSDLLADSVVLYTPAAGEIVGPVYLRDVTLTDTLGMVVACSDGPDVNFNNLAGVKTDLYGSGIVPTSATGMSRINTATTPIVAGLTEDDLFQPPAGAWQANHHYIPDADTGESLVAAAGHLWLTGDDGDSGNAPPDFAGNIGGTVVDNDLTWTDDGALPTQGSMHVYADVSTPVAP